MSGPAEGALPTIGVVVLTQGARPAELARALESLRAQLGVLLDIVCVGNGWQVSGIPEGVKALSLPQNLGIPAGRNEGVAEVAGDYLFFLDDDEALRGSDFLSEAVRMLQVGDIGLLQPRVVDPAGRPAPRRWIPRLRKGDPARSSNVFSVIEGAVLLPRSVFEAAGGWAAEFFYAHEGIELAWRVWDQGLRVWYAGGLVAEHPATSPTRHAEYYRLNARNRVWLARRNLPWLLVPGYVLSWTLVQLLRWVRMRQGLRPWFRGWWQGWTHHPGQRRPMRWATVWRMTRHGRFPII